MLKCLHLRLIDLYVLINAIISDYNTLYKLA